MFRYTSRAASTLSTTMLLYDDTEENVSEENISEENFSEENVSEENISEENQLVRLSSTSRSFEEMDLYDLDSLVMKTDHTLPIEKALLCIFKQNASPDLAVQIGKHVVHVHYDVMFAYSKLFRKLQVRKCVWKMPTCGLSLDGFRKMYQWMLEVKLRIKKRKDFVELMLAAQIFHVPKLLEQLWTLMASPTLFVEHFAAIAYVEARRSTPLLKRLKYNLIHRVCNAFLTFVAHNEFLVLEFNEVNMFLESGCAAVNCELEMLYAAVRWLNAHWEKREKYLNDLIRAIRYGNLTAEEVSSFFSDDAIEVKRVLLSTDLKKKLQFSLVHKMVSQSYFQLAGADDAPRCWIHDRCCSYHHKSACFQKLRYKYNDFKEYLKLLSEKELDHWRTFITEEPNERCCQNAKCLHLNVVQVTANTDAN